MYVRVHMQWCLMMLFGNTYYILFFLVKYACISYCVDTYACMYVSMLYTYACVYVSVGT